MWVALVIIAVTVVVIASCVGRNFYDGQRRTTSVCRDVGGSACAAATVGRPHHYHLVGLGRVMAAATIDERLGASLNE